MQNEERKKMTSEIKKSSAVIPSSEGCPKGGVGSCAPNPKNTCPGVARQQTGEERVIVRNKAGLTRRARKSELKWFADRGFVEDSALASRGYVPGDECEKVGRGQPVPPSENPKSQIGNRK